MKQLVVLVGLPGSGKTALQREHPEWAVVSRGMIRQSVFRCSYDPAYEGTVEKIFLATLVEALDSPADVVCVDEPNLTKAERAVLIELACLSGRHATVRVLPTASPESAYERMQRNLKRVALEKPHLRVRSFSRRAYEALVAQYEPVEETEGFASLAYETGSLPPCPAAARGREAAREPLPVREPLPLFSR